MSVDLAAIRARADAAWDEHSTPRDLLASADDVPALLALVDAQAARIDKALALHEVVTDDEGFEDCDSCHDEWPCPTVRALTEDVTQ